MARKPREHEEQNEQPKAHASYSTVDLVDDSVPLVNQSPVMPSAADRDGDRVVVVAAPPRFRVLATQYVMAAGGRTILRAGKIITAHNFDLHALIAQGVRLEEATDTAEG